MDLNAFISVDLIVELSLSNHEVHLGDFSSIRLGSFDLILPLHYFFLNLLDLVSGKLYLYCIKFIMDREVLVFASLLESRSSLFR